MYWLAIALGFVVGVFQVWPLAMLGGIVMGIGILGLILEWRCGEQ